MFSVHFSKNSQLIAYSHPLLFISLDVFCPEKSRRRYRLQIPSQTSPGGEEFLSLFFLSFPFECGLSRGRNNPCLACDALGRSLVPSKSPAFFFLPATIVFPLLLSRPVSDVIDFPRFFFSRIVLSRAFSAAASYIAF